MFSSMKNVALNDLHLYNVNSNCWLTVAIYGEIPTSRWGHCLTLQDSVKEDYQSNTLIIFGGINLKSFCDTSVYEINFSKTGINRYLEETEKAILD